MIVVDHVSYGVLRGVSLRVEPGRVIALVGENGAGKSTLLRLLNGGLAPASGSVTVDGRCTSSPSDLSEIRRTVGLVRQDPELQLVAPSLADEVAFGPRNLGWPEEAIASSCSLAMATCRLVGLEDRSTDELSGGEKQRLALAGVLAMKPSYLLLDEVCAHLDQVNRAEVRLLVARLKARGVGIVLASHDPSDLSLADEIYQIADGTLRLISTGQATGLLDSRSFGSPILESRPLGAPSDITLKAENLTLEHRSLAGSRTVLRDFSARFKGGEVTLLTGPSGSGKSTLLTALAGVLKPISGQVVLEQHDTVLYESNRLPGHVGYAQQRVADQLFCETVLDEVSYGPNCLGMSDAEAAREAEHALLAVGAPQSIWQRSPFELSGGEARRVGLADVLALSPRAYLFDEPTAGLDARGRAEFIALARRLANMGAPVVVSTHDAQEWEGIADARVELTALPQTQEQKRQYTSPAWFELLFLLAFAAAAFTLSEPWQTAALAGVLALKWLVQRVPLRTAWTALRSSLVVMLFALLANTITLDGSGDLTALGFGVASSAGLAHGLRGAVRILLLVESGVLCATLVNMQQVAEVLFAPLRALGLPVDGAETAIMLALCNLSEASRSFVRIEQAQRSRGARLEGGGVVRRLQTYLSVLAPLVVSMLRRSAEIAEAMRDRCYGAGPRTR